MPITNDEFGCKQVQQTISHQIKADFHPMAQQIRKLAERVFKTMEWISKYFGGTETVGSMINAYAASITNPPSLTYFQALNLTMTNGIPSSDLPGLASTYFYTTSTNNLFTSIDNGHPVMGTIIDQNVGHEVMIIGYNNNGTMEYFDPQTGHYSTKTPTQFHNVIEIIGKK